MDIDIREAERMLRGMVRRGIVCELNTKESMVRVNFEDKDATVSAELKVLNRGSGVKKDYWIPELGDEVLCIFENNDENLSDGYVVGSFFCDTRPPQVDSADIMRIDFGDGSYIEHDRSTGNLTIDCTGEVTIRAKRINLN